MVNKNSLKNLRKGRTGCPGKDAKLKRAIIAAVKANDLAKWKKEHFNDFMKAVVSLLPKTVGLGDPTGKPLSITVEVVEKKR